MPGVICIEQVTLFTFIIVLVIGLMILFYYYMKNENTNNNKHTNSNNNKYIYVQENQYETQHNRNTDNMYKTKYPFGYVDVENDVLLNPYSAPLKDDRYFPKHNIDVRGSIPIQVATRAVDTTYRQVGILTRLNGDETILPLMGRPLFTNRDKWNFYTMSDKNNMIKLPVSFKGKSCTNEYGCDNIYNGDTVYVEGYGDAFKATIYDNNVMRYIPFL